MNSYLKIAESVLEAVRRPLHAEKILEYGYLNDLVPSHVYGKTQHKTLQARLSEDILAHEENSLFYRTEPGIFFLRKFLNDDSIPDKYKEVFFSRRRARDLLNKPVLTLNYDSVKSALRGKESINGKRTKDFFSFENIKYLPYENAQNNKNFIVWAFVIIFRDYEILTYRRGKYREGRDAFVNQKTIGFSSVITDSDRNLFEQNDHGLMMSGVNNAIIDLSTHNGAFDNSNLKSRSNLDFLLSSENENKASDLIGVVTFDCPEWFEPTNNKLAINNLKWQDIRKPINHIEDFDPWSQKVFDKVKFLIKKRIAS